MIPLNPAPAGLIDCQSHPFCPELVGLMEERATDPVAFTQDGARFVRMGNMFDNTIALTRLIMSGVLDALRSVKLPPAEERRLLSGNARNRFGISV